ncbi:MAG TPA: hypothetical protein VL572_12605 [Pyrinomonadaceae bacterium]|nr:hypothetical protein [Pyrinomonadaceae bacterium]
MKICPNCHTQYTDDTLRFCLQDGSPLTAVSATQQSTVSRAGQEVETVAREPDGSVITQLKRDSQVTRVTGHKTKSRPSVVLWIAAAAFLFMFLGGIVALGFWLYFKDRPPVAANLANRNGNRNGVTPMNINPNLATPTRTPLDTSTPAATATVPPSNIGSNVRDMLLGPSPAADKAQASSEVSQQVQSWQSSTESGDIGSLVGKYAPSVQYYNKSGASPEFIGADKQRAYRMFDSMSIQISNMEISISESGETATAHFDKEWVFTGRRRSTGKVRQQLQFRRINGRWLITSERDVRVYYTN